MNTLYKQLVKLISDKLNRAPTYVAHCILGRYKAKRSEIPVFIECFKQCGIQVSERDFLCGTRVSNNLMIRLFRSMHTRPKHDKHTKHVEQKVVNPVDNIMLIDV